MKQRSTTEERMRLAKAHADSLNLTIRPTVDINDGSTVFDVLDGSGRRLFFSRNLGTILTSLKAYETGLAHGRAVSS